MGTTITVALVEDGVVAFGHVGDSRAYLIRDKKLDQLTEDHSLVAELVRSGRLTPEEAEFHPQRSVITRALGTDPDVDVDTFSIESKAGDLFLLCSDGLTSMIDDTTILDVVERSRDDFGTIGEELIAAANRNGGEDNITVVFFEMAEERQAPAETKAMPVMATPAETKAMPVAGAPAETKAMPVAGAMEASEPDPDEDTLSGLEKIPVVDTMVVSPEEAAVIAAEVPPKQPHERLSVRAARVVVGLAVVAGLALLVWWLFGQST
jgi:protein phosphatase